MEIEPAAPALSHSGRNSNSPSRTSSSAATGIVSVDESLAIFSVTLIFCSVGNARNASSRSLLPQIVSPNTKQNATKIVLFMPLTTRSAEAPPEDPAHASVGVAPGCLVDFPVSRPDGRVDVSVSGDGEGTNPQRG